MAKQELRAIISADARAFMRTMGKVRGVALSAAKLIGGAAAAGAAAYGYAVKSTANELDKLAKMQARTGAGAEWLQRMAHAAELSDVSIEGLGTTFKALAKNLGDAGRGRDPFERYGLSARALAQLAPEDQMQAVLEKLSAIPDAAKRSAAAQELLGKSGTELLPMLANGVAGFRALQSERDKLGPLFAQTDLKNAEAFNDSLTRLGRAARVAMGRLAATQFGPLTERITALTERIVALQQTPGFKRLAEESGALARNVTTALAQLLGAQAGDPAGGIADGLAKINAELAKMAANQDFVTLRDTLAGIAKVLGLILRFTSEMQETSIVGIGAKAVGEYANVANAVNAAQGQGTIRQRISRAGAALDPESFTGKVFGAGREARAGADQLLARMVAATETVANAVTGRQ